MLCEWVWLAAAVLAACYGMGWHSALAESHHRPPVLVCHQCMRIIAFGEYSGVAGASREWFGPVCLSQVEAGTAELCEGAVGHHTCGMFGRDTPADNDVAMLSQCSLLERTRF